MENKKPESQVSVSRSGRQHGGQGSCQHLARKDLQSQVGSRADEVLTPAGQSLWQPMPREISVTWSCTLVCGAQLSQQWSEVHLSIPLRVMHSTLLGLLISVLAPLMASEELPQETMYGWSHSADTAVLVKCANILGVSPCQVCLA